MLLAIAAALIYAVYILAGARVMEKFSARQSSAVIFVSAALVFGLLAGLRGPSSPMGAAGWWSVIGISLAATIVPVVTFLAGLKIVGPADAALLSTIEPVVTVLLAAWLFGEAVYPAMWLGGALILGAVLLLGARQRRGPSLGS